MPYYYIGSQQHPREMGKSRALWQQFISASLARLKAGEPPHAAEESDRFIVCVVTRPYPNIYFVLRNAMLKLGRAWGLQVLVTRDTEAWISGLLAGWPGVHVDQLTAVSDDRGGFDQNRLKRSEDFWDLVRGRHQLFVDEESIICHSEVDEFLQYDYIGAPWGDEAFSPWCRYGAGGFSMRRKESMIRVCRECNTNAWMIGPEDVFYSVTMRLEQGKYCLPADEVARRFAVGRIHHPRPFALHRAWAYLPSETLRGLLNGINAEC